MGKTARWFRGLLGGKKECSRSSSSSPGGSNGKPAKEKRRWSFVVRSSTKGRESSSITTTTTTTPAPSTGVDRRRGSNREGSGSCSSASPCGGYNLTGDASVVVDPNKHAIAVAAATAAVAEAAVAAAQAAAAVVKLTSSSGRCTTAAAAYVSGSSGLCNNNEEDWAAVKIQSAFRGYLARRALRALKGLVKLQALVRGHIMRKKTADTMRCMQALVRVQARARAGRFKISDRRNLNKQLSQSHLPGPATPEKYEHAIRSNSTRYDRTSSLKRNGSKQNSRDIYELDRVNSSRTYADHWIRTGPLDDEKSDKILEIDPGKPQFDHRRGNLSESSQHALTQDRISHSFTAMDSPSKDSTTAQLSTSSPSSGEVQSMHHPHKFPIEIDDVFSTAENSPHFYSASSSRAGGVRRGPFTPTKSECSRSFYSGYSDHPNYMANTESSRAKVRSQSAPKQRLEFEKCSSMKRYSVYGFGDARSSAHKTTSTSTLHANFTRKAYPGSGRLDRLGMPVHSDITGFNGISRNRY